MWNEVGLSVPLPRYSLAAAFKRLTLLWACSQFCFWIKTVGCHDNRGVQGRNLYDTIA